MKPTNKVALIVELAKEVAVGDPICWDNLSLDEDAAYGMMAASILEHAESMPMESRDIIMLATITKLVVENFVLNLRLS